jgi:hypothetical protein
MVGVAIGWRVDDDLQAFVGVERAVVETVLGADIGRGMGGKLTVGNSVEFGAVVFRKEDIVVSQREAIDFDIAKECHCRERACSEEIGRSRFDTEGSGGEGGAVGVEDDCVRGKALAVGKLDA